MVKEDGQGAKFVQMAFQEMIIEKKKIIVTITDISEVVENYKLNQKLRDIKQLSCGLKQEVSTPMRCLTAIADEAEKTGQSNKYTFRAISHTTTMVASFVEGFIDELLLNSNNLELNVEHLKLFQDVVLPIFDLF